MNNVNLELQKKNKNTKIIPLFLLLGFLLSLLCLMLLISFFGVREITIRLLDVENYQRPVIERKNTLTEIGVEGTETPLAQGSYPIEIIPEISIKPWDGAGRVTVLLLGVDYRDWSSGEGPSRSDTMILVTLDPTTKEAGMLSIPRDLWVSIPGFEHGKINTAYYLGDAYRLPGGGPGLAVETVESLLGIPINYFAQIDFGAFVKFIDGIGGVKIDVPEEITVDLLGTGSATKKMLQPGRQVLPGEWALAYARARYTGGGDFDRAKRQQQVILAIRDKIISLDQLPILITKAPTLYKELSSGVRTNLALDEVIKLALLAQEVPQENIKRGFIGEDNVYFGFSPDGLSILIPIPDDIHLLRDEIFASSGVLIPKTMGSPEEKMLAENAKLAIYNASQMDGLETKTADFLQDKGCRIVEVATASEIYANTTIIDHSGNPYLLSYLVDLLSIHPSKIYIQSEPENQADVELFLGIDWQSNNILP